jgi:hypothetical protein
MWPETRREKEALDRHITGNYGEDQFKEDEEERYKNCANCVAYEDEKGCDTCTKDNRRKK